MYFRVKHQLPSTQFKARNSLLTDLLENNVNIRVIYNLALVVVVTSQLRYLLDNYFTNGSFEFNWEFFKISFSKPYQLFYIWVCIFLAALPLYLGFVLWATIRNKIKILAISFFDRLSLTIFILYLVTYTYCFACIIHQNDFKPASGFALMMELVRFKMKNYAFVRSNVPRTMKFKHHDKDGILYPSISKYMYFLFAPTLVYQDEYPRSQSIRWKKVAEHFSNFGGSLLLIYIIMEHFVTRFEIFSRDPFEWNNFVVLVLELVPISGMFLFAMNYFLLHCWFNAWAEMLRFSDREFYKNFWACTLLENFNKTWNKVVQEWLYVYVYKDCYEIIWPNNTIFAKAMVFAISALYHEFIMGLAFNLFTRGLFVKFFTLGFVTSAFFSGYLIPNFVYLLGNGIGNSALICAFGTRYYYETMK